MIQLDEKRVNSTRIFISIFSIFTITLILWSFLFEIDIVSDAEGQVIPVGDIKTIQHLEGGIIEKILVKESEVVSKDQPLVILAGTSSEVELEELQVRVDTQIIKQTRLEAEINFFDIPIFPDDLVTKRPEVINKSMELYVSRKDNFDGAVKEIDTIIDQKKTNLDILLSQAEMSAELLEEKIISEYNHLNMLKELNAAKGEFEELIEKKENIRNNFIEESRDEMQLAQRELSQSYETLKKLTDNLDRTTIVAPVDGVVKNLFFVTEGGVIKPGGSILDIVPTKDNLIVEARLPNSDIGFVTPGQSAVIKLSSSDSVNFGQINATVSQISPDSEQDEKDERVVFYKILLETESNFFESKNKIYRLTPGVKVVASINIGERTVANYLLSPFIGSLGSSFKER